MAGTNGERGERAAVRREKRKRNLAWSEKIVRKEEQEKRKDKKIRKRKWLRAQAAEPSHEGLNTPGENNEVDGDDWAELAREERMAKKVKRGDISQKVFDAEFGDL